jgi:hypothetical protein
MGVSQVKSKELRAVDEPELPLSRKALQITVPVELIRAKKNSGAAFTYACDTSGLEDKEIYLALGLDAGYFSRMKKGDATLQADKLREFCDHVGNNIYAEWLAFQLGCTLVQIESETARQLRIVTEQRDQERRERLIVEETMRRIITGAGA